MSIRSFITELRRRNVLRAGVLYVGAIWALAQGISQLGPSFGAPEWLTRAFVIAGMVGLPFWLVFAWFYELTPEGLKRESDIAPGESITRQTGRKFDFAIIGVLAVAVVLLLTERLVPRAKADAVSDQSVAVLPLTNEGGDPKDQYFSDGLSEDLITALSQFPGLKVIARDSAFRFRDSKEEPAAIAGKLGVAHLLEGSVRRLGDAVRISATLVKASDGSSVWSQHYDRPYKDLFALQDEISRAVSGALHAKLLGAAPAQSERPASGSIAAYEAVLQGNFLLERHNEADTRKAIDFYRQATALDSNYAYAWARLAFAESVLLSSFTPAGQAEREVIGSEARAASANALRIAPDLAEAHRARGWLSIANRDVAAILPEMRRAAELAPQDANTVTDLGRAQSFLGRLEEAVATFGNAIRIDPLSARARYDRAVVLVAIGRDAEAEADVRQAIELQPKASQYRALLAIAQMQQGQYGSAVATAQQEPDPFWRIYALALTQWGNGDHAASDVALRELIAQNADDAGSQIATVYAQRRQPEEMLRWLEHGRDTNDGGGVVEILSSPFFRAYLDDQRFIAFAREIGVMSADAAASSAAQ